MKHVGLVPSSRKSIRDRKRPSPENGETPSENGSAAAPAPAPAGVSPPAGISPWESAASAFSAGQLSAGSGAEQRLVGVIEALLPSLVENSVEKVLDLP